MECSSCDSANSDGKNDCRDCGRPLSVRCAACESENPSGKRFLWRLRCRADADRSGACIGSGRTVDVLRAAAIKNR